MGIARSLFIYHGRPSHMRKMVRFYGALVSKGDLVFDIGAHAGDRTRAFRRLGCRVIAVEPQPGLLAVLRLLYGRSRHVEIVAAAVSDDEKDIKLSINSRNPTVSTASSAFIRAAQAGAPGWHGQVWDNEIETKAVTLDRLISTYGLPAFVKIDVEGLEDRVLAGLSASLPALSFEFTTHQRDVAFRCLERLRALGAYRFNACLGESWERAFGELQDEASIARWLTSLPAEANSGDIYCFRAA
jgi:FkbM family methyltransferase